MSAPGGLAPLEDLEIASGTVLEPASPVRVAPGPRDPRGARGALEDLVLPALARGPVSVSFSGGRDSSLVLAVACHVARREGLPDPVAVTIRHESPDSEETAFQELVVAHLGLQDWVRVDVGTDMDLLGADATDFLRASGVLAPPNAYLHLPMVRAAGSGTLLTGAGGDEILGPARDRYLRVLQRAAPPRPRDALSLGYALAPRRVRRWREQRRPYPFAPWLTASARLAVQARLGAATAAESPRWDVSARSYARSRGVVLGNAGLAQVGAHHGVDVQSPLLATGFVDAFAADLGWAGPPDRTTSMRRLAGDLLPVEVVERRTKAVFDAVVWGPRYREFARTWTPDLLAPGIRSLVELDRLAEELAGARPVYQLMALVQQSWLRSGAAGRQEPLQG